MQSVGLDFGVWVGASRFPGPALKNAPYWDEGLAFSKSGYRLQVQEQRLFDSLTLYLLQ